MGDAELIIKTIEGEQGKERLSNEAAEQLIHEYVALRKLGAPDIIT